MSFFFCIFACAFVNRVAQTDRSALIKATDASALPHHKPTACVGDPIIARKIIKK